MKASELRGKTPDELRDQLSALKKEQFNLRFRRATGEVENTARFRTLRRDVARINTILTERALDAAQGADASGAGAAEES